MNPLHIFKPGTHIAMNGKTYEFSEADLAAAAAAYDPALHEAPLVIGHPKDNDPAYGWVKSLAIADGGLFGEPDQVDPEFAELHRLGRFKKRSASFYHPEDPRNPVPGVYYLRHVGFLGAQPPAVKGLKAANFAEADALTIEFSEETAWGLRSLADMLRGVRDLFIEKFSLEEADRVLPTYRIDSVAEFAGRELDKAKPAEPAFTEPQEKESQMDEKQLKEQQAKLEQEKADFAEQQKEFKQQQEQQAAQAAKRRVDDAMAFCEGLVSRGTLLPAHKQVVGKVLAAIPDTARIEFGEGDNKTSKDLGAEFKAFLSSLPQKIEFGEVAGTDLGDPPANKKPETVAFSEDLTSRV